MLRLKPVRWLVRITGCCQILCRPRSRNRPNLIVEVSSSGPPGRNHTPLTCCSLIDAYRENLVSAGCRSRPAIDLERRPIERLAESVVGMEQGQLGCAERGIRTFSLLEAG